MEWTPWQIPISGQAGPLLPMSCEELAGGNLPFRANISCFYDACSKALLVKLPIFLTNLNISWLFASSLSFLETLWGRDDPAHRAVSIAQLSLHCTQPTLSSRNTQGNSNITFNAFSVAKKNTFLPGTTHLTRFLQQGLHQHRARGAALQDDWEERQQRRGAVSPVHGWEGQGSSHSQDWIWRVTCAAFRSQLAPSSRVSLLPLSACVQCAHRQHKNLSFSLYIATKTSSKQSQFVLKDIKYAHFVKLLVVL